MRRSMSRTGNCWDNTPTESCFGSLKMELDGGGPSGTWQAARTARFRGVEPRGSPGIEGWRNRQRLHPSLGCVTPANKEQPAAAA